jgi:hypothetical protein
MLGPDRSRPENDERFLPLFLGLFLLAATVAIGAWRSVPRYRVDFDRSTRSTGPLTPSWAGI